MLGLVSDVVVDASRTLVALAFGGGGIALLCWVALVRRLERWMTGRPLKPTSLRRKLAIVLVALASSTVSIVAAMLLAALGGQRRVGDSARLAEVQCLERAPGKLRLYFVPIDRDGQRGATRVFDLDGARCAITGEVTHLRPAFRLLGPAYARIVRVAGKPAKEEDGNPRPTIFSITDEGSGWWAARGAHGPLRLMTADTDGNAVLADPDPRARFDVTLTPTGFALVKQRP